MKVVALVSGGKDSTFNMMQCVAAGHEIVALANLVPHARTEIDSYMYQSVGHEAIDLIAAAMDMPLYKQETMGKSIQQGKTYEPSKDDEVEDLFLLLKRIKDEIDFEGVSVGAILSDYQRIRVENVCIRLGLVPLAYLWQRDQKELLDEMIKCEVDAIIIKVAALGLDPFKHLRRTLSLMQPHLHAMHEKYGLNICGEGGEYETLTLDCPLFKSRIVINESDVVMHTNDPIAPVGYLKFNKLSLQVKLPALDLDSRLKDLPLKDSDGYITDQGEEALEGDETENDGELIQNDNCIESPDENTTTIPTSSVAQKPLFAKSADGWLWIGGVQGRTSNPYAAMKQAMSILKSILTDNDQSLTDICSITMFISDMSQYAELNKLYVETLDHVNPPARACVQVPFDEDCPVTIEVLSWSPPVNNSGDAPIERHTMHVQSRSHWAPSNIGPYSQSVRVGDVINLAGQIGLVPGSLEMVNGGIKPQCQLALRHIGRLLKAVDPQVNLRDVVQAVCYVTDKAYVEPSRQIWEGKTNNAIVDYVVVTGLPKNALVEWHVWAHRHNNQFEYEETGMCVENYSISIFRRWNYENNIAAIVCHVDRPEEESVDGFNHSVIDEALDYTIKKLQQGHENDAISVYNLKVFYSTMNRSIESKIIIQYLDILREKFSLVYTVVPVVCLKNKHTFLSICGVRFQ